MTHFAFLSTLPPTRCGLATFTEALAGSLVADSHDTASFVRVLDNRDELDTNAVEIMAGALDPTAVLVANDLESMRDATAVLNASDVVIVQHEYGIFGGIDGDDVVRVLDDVTAPIIVVLHTVLTAPTPHQRQVLIEVCDRSAAIVVMTEHARVTLAAVFGVDGDRVVVIPHGVASIVAQPRRGGRPQRILTWGLISPGKGIEWGIRAMSRLRDLGGDLHYLVAGQTHPKVLANAGESYRTMLSALVTELDLEPQVRLDGRYLDADELADVLSSTDVVLLPYDSRDQVTSGVLAQAVAAGIPVVATGFPHATELLADGAGIVVAHEDPASIARALRTILSAETVAESMRRSAMRSAANTSWPEVAERYRTIAVALTHLQVA